ncbi:hypothetical protein B0T21DRAFT_366577 [Apiosordaria backusii]|uniref:Uncharacterized protein n=1 Tax=Apiosordaria backusii TaxID=314023 RepID=A0AA40EG36_9PEZI|nr:hypothetical protein B0T21DRAFT_366577 [Apiosordaria backusii]
MSLGRKKHYFLPPIPESPPDGPIQLGSIISSPELVFEPINNYPVAPASYPEKVYEHNSGPSSLSLGRASNKSLGVFAELPAFIDSTLGYEWARANTESWTFDNLRTIWFTPSVEYVRQSIGDTQVQQFVNDNKSWLGGISLYMVTGVKIAYGASMLSEFARTYGFNGTVGLDLSSLGVPITVGPEAGLEKSSTLTASSNSVDPVVFAFRLRRIRIKASGDLKLKDHTKDALLGLKDKEGKPLVPFDTDGVEEEDATGLEFNVENDGEVLDEVPVGEEGEETSTISYCKSG